MCAHHVRVGEAAPREVTDRFTETFRAVSGWVWMNGESLQRAPPRSPPTSHSLTSPAAWVRLEGLNKATKIPPYHPQGDRSFPPQVTPPCGPHPPKPGLRAPGKGRAVPLWAQNYPLQTPNPYAAATASSDVVPGTPGCSASLCVQGLLPLPRGEVRAVSGQSHIRIRPRSPHQ